MGDRPSYKQLLEDAKKQFEKEIAEKQKATISELLDYTLPGEPTE